LSNLYDQNIPSQHHDFQECKGQKALSDQEFQPSSLQMKFEVPA